MKIMSDDDALDSVDTEDTEEDVYPARNSKTLKSLRSSTGNDQEMDQNNSRVRRSTRNKFQTYDNLSTSWIFGTQTLKGYPMYKQPGSSSDKEMVDETPSRPRRQRRMPIRSRENHPPNKAPSRYMRDRSSLIHSSSRELRVRPRRLRSDRELRELRDRPIRDRELRERRERPDLRDRESRNRVQLRDRSDRDLRDKNDIDLRALKERQDRDRAERDSKENKTEEKHKSDVKSIIEEKELRSRKSDSPCRSREGPVTRLSNSYAGKDEKSKSEQNEDDDENSQESEKAENNDNSENDDNDGYEDMYTRIKRTRRASQRQLQKRQIAEDSDMSESSDTPCPRKYSLRQKKPTVDRFQANVEPVRRSIRAFRSVLSNSMRRRKHRSKSSSSSSSSDSEPQRYDKKKSKKSRQSAIPQGGPSDKKADISPISVDTNITFNDVGGLESHIHCLKEMVVFPMMYPDVFDRFHITPPKGVLFHGPPGTGKTLIARALANECSQGSRKVSFFMRKGADCLTKWVGESERQLRLLFEQAQQMKPSIIFFDEIDGLAPVRSTKQDQIHASIVSTLLALMDGLSDRGEVIIIGATNRIDAIDPALRRPGRFDRELFFPLPAMKERLEILKIHVKKWDNSPPDDLLQTLADQATGYCGSDLKALCTEAVIQGLKRTYPQIYLSSNRLLLNPERVEVKKVDFTQASSLLVPSTHRITPCVGRKLAPYIEPLLNPSLQELLTTIKKIFPQGSNHALAKIKVSRGIHRPRLLITGGTMARNQGPQLAKAVIHHMEHLPVHTLNVSTLFAQSARSPEEACVQVFNEATRNIPSIIYITAIDQWWPLVPETVKAVFLCRIASLDPSIPILILATSEVTYEELPDQLKNLFSTLREEIHSIFGTTEEQRSKFFKPIFMVQSLRPPPTKKKNVEELEELPLAPEEPKKLTEEEKRILYEKEEISLRELRIFLREICAKLARNRQFFMFTKPVDTEEVPDYNEIIEQPMDLETMMTKIDMHCYLCARDFLDDIDLICRNALEYNPDSLRDRPSLGLMKRDPADKLIRHRACSLRDNAYALIKAELDSDFEDKCREISKSRKVQKEVVNKKESSKADSANADDKSDKKETSTGSAIVLNGNKFTSSRKRRIRAWARGYVKKVHKKKKISFEDCTNNENNSNKPASSCETSAQGIDLQKFQEFETEAHSVLNGHIPFFEHTDTDNDSQNELARDASQQNHSDVPADNGTSEKRKNSELENMEVSLADNEKTQENSSHNSSRRESLNAEDLSFVLDSDSSFENNTEDSDKIEIDKNELEKAYAYTVKATAKFPIELLCDIYVQLSRRIGLYARTYDRKSLPKDLLEDVKRFEDYNTREIEKFTDN